MTYTNQSTGQSVMNRDFFLLQLEDTRAYKNVTKTQRRVLSYFNSLDPRGNDLTSKTVKELAAELGLSARRVVRELDALNRSGLLKVDVH